MRLDLYLVDKGIVESRARAKMEIESGNVVVNNKILKKPAYDVKQTDLIVVQNKLKWVSRGGLKLEKGIESFSINFNEKVVLDIGSSTGGFSDVALTNGAKKIYCVDTGKNILHEKIRKNPKVSVFESTDYRDLDISSFEKIDIVVIDVSFISLTKILPKLKEDFVGKDVLIFALIKPQFEVGIELARKYKGIIKDKKLHQSVVDKILHEFLKSGFKNTGVEKSPILGGDGNTEFISCFKTDKS